MTTTTTPIQRPSPRWQAPSARRRPRSYLNRDDLEQGIHPDLFRLPLPLTPESEPPRRSSLSTKSWRWRSSKQIPSQFQSKAKKFLSAAALCIVISTTKLILTTTTTATNEPSARSLLYLMNDASDQEDDADLRPMMRRPQHVVFDHPMSSINFNAHSTIALPDTPLHYHGVSHGGIEYRPISSDAIVYSRMIDPEDEEKYQEMRYQVIELSDDPFLSREELSDEDLEDDSRPCRRPSFKAKPKPNCNTVHELALDRPQSLENEFQISRLGKGLYRSAWLYNSTTNNDDFVMRRLQLVDRWELDQENIVRTQRDAIVSEQLSSSPLIADAYAYCATSMASESLMGGGILKRLLYEKSARHVDKDEIERENADGLHPRNDYSVEEKLRISLRIAEGFATIHGFAGGVILNGDAHPGQWLYDKEGNLKLIDFNLGEILDYNVEKQEYCKVHRLFSGYQNAPEEYDGDANEEADIYVFGNIMYSLLTGLWPFYEIEDKDYKIAQQKLKAGERPYIDPRYRTRSVGEGAMIEIIEKAWDQDMDKRLTAFEAIPLIQAAVEKHKKAMASY